MANRLTVWRLSRQCHGVRKRVASVKVCPLGGPAIPWRWQQRLAHTDVQPTHPLSGRRRRVSGRSEAGKWVCPTFRAEEQRRPPTWGIRPLCCEKNEGTYTNVRVPGGGPRCSGAVEKTGAHTLRSRSWAAPAGNGPMLCFARRLPWYPRASCMAATGTSAHSERRTSHVWSPSARLDGKMVTGAPHSGPVSYIKMLMS